MLDMCVDGARVAVERWRQFLLSPAGVYLYSLITGMIGVFILLFFLSKALSSAALLMLLPCIIAFNSASSGYGMINRHRSFPRAKPALFSIAALLAAAGCIASAYLFPWESVLNWVRWTVCTVAAMTGAFFGSWIAVKKHALNENTIS